MFLTIVLQHIRLIKKSDFFALALMWKLEWLFRHQGSLNDITEYFRTDPAHVMYEIEFWTQKIQDRNFFNLGKYFETNLCEFLHKSVSLNDNFFQGTHTPTV